MFTARYGLDLKMQQFALRLKRDNRRGKAISTKIVSVFFI